MSKNRPEFDQYFMLLAKAASTRSGCNSRPTGAIVVKDDHIIATGYNGSLPGQPQCTDRGDKFCHRRSIGKDDKGENKYSECVSVHAEANAICQAAQFGIKLDGATIYTTLFPCIFCLKHIYSVGITEIIYETMYESDDPERDNYWKSLVKDLNITTRQVKLLPNTLKLIGDNVILETSRRRL